MSKDKKEDPQAKRVEALEKERSELRAQLEAQAATLEKLAEAQQVAAAEHRRVLDAQQARITQLEGTVEAVSAIRDDIILRQTVNWSAHIYPLVAVLAAAGYHYDQARAAEPTKNSKPSKDTEALLAEIEQLKLEVLALQGTRDSLRWRCLSLEQERETLSQQYKQLLNLMGTERGG